MDENNELFSDKELCNADSKLPRNRGTLLFIHIYIYIKQVYNIYFIFAFLFYRNAAIFGLHREILRKIRYDAGEQISPTQT